MTRVVERQPNGACGMWDEDQDLRDALRTELIEWTPPPLNGGLREVISLGRRRRRTQQLGLALALVATITGTAFIAAAVGRPNALPPADPSPTAGAAAWPRAGLPAHTPYGTREPGTSAVPSVPRCSSPHSGRRNVDTVRAGTDLQKRVTDALNTVAGQATVGQLTEMHTLPSRAGTVDAYVYTADVTDTGGTGSVTFSIGAFAGDPLAAADEQAFDELNCDPPKRQVLADGTVLQIYATRPSEPFVSLTQILRIYRPDGTLYTLQVRNFGSPDFAPNLDQPDVPERVGAGRDTLPLTEARLADLGLAIAKD